MTDKSKPAIQDKEVPKLTKKIGTMTYEVAIHFSDTSAENLDDKVLRLMKHEVSPCR